jgi:hydrogenase expression/formation protein HypE
MGKLSTENLNKLLNCIKTGPNVIVPPQVGFDSGVHLIDDKYLVVSTDPCIGVPRKWFGWLLINYAASDVALFGARPAFCTINLLGPQGTKAEVFHMIMKQTCNAAEQLQIAIVTGHTGTYKGLSTIAGVCTAYGTVEKEKLITPAQSKPGDRILCIKPVGLETAVNFALMHKATASNLFGTRRTKELANLVTMQSCVKEASLLTAIAGVHAMHDATEGGLVAALNEMAEASGLGFKIYKERLPISQEVHGLQRHFQLSDNQVLSMSSTGTILAAISSERKETVETCLDQNRIENSAIGTFTKDKRRLLNVSGKDYSFPRRATDPYQRIVSATI